MTENTKKPLPDTRLLSLVLDIAKAIQGLKHCVEVMAITAQLSDAQRKQVDEGLERALEGQNELMNSVKTMLSDATTGEA
jgi:hypothetical protein